MMEFVWTPAGRARCVPTRGMQGRARQVRAQHEARFAASRFDAPGGVPDEHDLVAEACWSILLGQGGVEHHWLDGGVERHDIVLHDGRRVDVKSRAVRGAWREEYCVAVPTYILSRGACDLLAFSVWERHAERMLLLGVMDTRLVAVLEQRGAAHRRAEGDKLTSGEKCTYPMFEVPARHVRPVRQQLPQLAHESYPGQDTPNHWLRYWPGLEGAAT